MKFTSSKSFVHIDMVYRLEQFFAMHWVFHVFHFVLATLKSFKYIDGRLLFLDLKSVLRKKMCFFNIFWHMGHKNVHLFVIDTQKFVLKVSMFSFSMSGYTHSKMDNN